MKAFHFTFLAVILSSFVRAPQSHARGRLEVVRLTCDYKNNPLGIDNTKPRLSWQLRSATPDVTQVAYRLRAWSARGNLWDSGKVSQSNSVFVDYAGKELRSAERVHWSVQVWDNQGRSAVSHTAWWEMGLLDAKDWQGDFVSGPPPTDGPLPVQKEGLFWIWYPEGDPAVAAPAAKRWLRRSFTLPNDARILSAYLGVAADGEANITVNNQHIGRAPGLYRLYPFDVRQALHAGENEIVFAASNGSDAAGVAAQLRVQLEGGSTIILSTDRRWQAHNGNHVWVAAKEAAPAGQGKFWRGVANLNVIDYFRARPAPQLRRVFDISGKVRSARLYVTALGLYEVELNGHKVGSEQLAPGWTDYGKRLQYQTHDVTSQVISGRNAIGAYVADGWYAGKVGYAGRSAYGDHARLLLNLVIETQDGKRQVIHSGPGWKATPGPIKAADLQDGETFDATALDARWSTPTYDDHEWAPAHVIARTPQDPRLVAEASLPVRVFEERKAVAVTQPSPGVYIFDFGQNMPGFAKLRAQAPRGTQITLRFGEMLNQDGSLYTENLRTAQATDRYTFAGLDRKEVWQPRFSIHGFRFVELVGFPGRPSRDVLTAAVVHSEMPVTGRLQTSNALVNQLVSNIEWGQRGNFISVPTDCPQRDERLGWLGDAQVFVRTAARNRNVLPFLAKWLADVRDAQSPAGAFSDVAPRAPATGDSTPGWGDAGVIIPWALYEEFGDLQLLRDNYAAMKSWVAWIRSNNPNLLWEKKQGGNFGDWLSLNANTDKTVLATAFFAQTTSLVAQTAHALGYLDDAHAYQSLAKQIRDAFVKAFVSSDARIKSDTQTAYVLALRFNLLPEPLREKALQHLVQDIESHAGHLTTGFIGVGHLLPTLSRFGRLDVAYKLLTKETFPSWGYSIKAGATTIWERWDGWTKEKGFASPTMNSFNHYSLGAVGEWLYDTVAGISPLEPGYRLVQIAPQPGGGLTRATGAVETPYGLVKSEWRCDQGKFQLQITIPPNARAKVTLPSSSSSTATASKTQDVGSGQHRFKGECAAP
ncbi:MAG: family 78 glycoside hydrolase catalytic domain [Deltaproteobacteria bacterium]|nr:family 78 glycoside hydrolase catalytic domain [Deltaproteobacteria bacterium]